MELSAGSTELETGLVIRAQRGDREAFCELVRCYRARVIDVIYRMCADPVLAEDAAQDAFVSAWQHLASFKPGTSFRSWLYRIAVNAALDLLRREKPAAALEEIRVAAGGERIEASIERQETAARVRAAVMALPAASRAVLILREYHDLSYREIAAALDLPLGTVMSRLSYARKLLMETLCPDQEEK